MKKSIPILSLFAAAAMLITAAGCGSDPAPANHIESSQTAVEQILNSSETASAPSSSDENGTSSETASASGEASETAGDIDVDLTVLSSTMVYSEVYNMMITPSEYKGKTVKMQGNIAFSKDEKTGKQYYACIIQDATACCSQGIEFEPTKDYSYPEDFPKEGEIVTVVGVFDTYTDGNYQYNTLRNAKML